MVKGVHTADDARRAVDAGANALVVSNHGGRQLDGVAPSIRVLPEVVAAVQRPDRDSGGRRHSARQRCRQGDVPGRARGA